MNTEFNVKGFFYESNGYKLRKYLDIKRVGVALNEPDLMVVMMNPGSSYPLDGIDDNSEPTEAVPDATQQQIMKVMNAVEFNYARILNLSDLRTPNSKELYRFLKSGESSAVEHSIFSSNRESELAQLFVNEVPVIFGWGVNPALVPLAKQAIDTLSISNPLGILKPNKRYSYYHPLPRVYAKQLEWVQYVVSRLDRSTKPNK